MNNFIACIEWVPYENGGRKKFPPKGTKYCPIIGLQNTNENVKWSIRFICPDFSRTNIIEFSFYRDDGPVDKIKINEEYSLFEGLRKVAKIQILQMDSHKGH